MAEPDAGTPLPVERKAPRKRRRVLRVLAWVVAVVVVLALAGVGYGVWTVRRSFPTTSGTVTLAGLTHDATVQRDARGIPTITAETSEDLFFAQGYVHAQDRFWEMDFRRHLTSGRLSELFGEGQVATDTFLRTLGWRRVAEKEVEALPPAIRGYYESYAAGVNAYLADHAGASLSLEHALLGFQNPGYAPEPWEPADSVAWMKAMAWDLVSNVGDEETRALEARFLDAERLAELYPGYPFDEHPVILADDPAGRKVLATAVVEGGGATAGERIRSAIETFQRTPLAELIAQADKLLGSKGEGIGSNSWVVSGAHTTTGRPLLANDPHLGAALPSVWTQAQLRCRAVTEACPFDVAGFSFSGLPGIVIGHNPHIAWGFTNLTTDVADLFVENVDGDRYLYDGQWKDMAVRQETIKVAGGEDVTITIRETGHGPVVSDLGYGWGEIAEGAKEPAKAALSLRWTALDPGTTTEAIFGLNLASDFAEFREAAALFAVPAQNLIYADAEGNIGYQTPGRLPIRATGRDGSLPTPGWGSEYDWQGFIPFEELPWTYNPEAGYIVTANNAIVNDDYRYHLTDDWDYGYRAARIVELLETKLADGPVSAADLAAIQLDNQMPAAASLKKAYEGAAPGDERLRTALGMLADWDGQNAPDSAAAAFANVLWEHLTARLMEGHGGEIGRGDQARLARFLELQLAAPDSPWWTQDGATTRQQLLDGAAADALAEITALQGTDPAGWNWGRLHAITLTHATFGTSGIGPVEALFNRGPYPVGGGSSVVNATGWNLGQGYATVTVPSMRMVVDVADWDASTWQNLTGQSGHPFHPDYVDQTEGWARGEQYLWAFTPQAVASTTTATLTLTPAD
ncbi:MAG: penicillin acylase family protein [Tessaracoccus sp.]|nr:penicillin acylase family protein [Tessaracoccus sp.]